MGRLLARPLSAEDAVQIAPLNNALQARRSRSWVFPKLGDLVYWPVPRLIP